MACQVSSPISQGGICRKDREGGGWEGGGGSGEEKGKRGNPFTLTDFLSNCLTVLETFGLSEFLLPISTRVLKLFSLLQKLSLYFWEYILALEMLFVWHCPSGLMGKKDAVGHKHPALL